MNARARILPFFLIVVKIDSHYFSPPNNFHKNKPIPPIITTVINVVLIVSDENGVAISATGDPLACLAVLQLAMHHATAKAGDLVLATAGRAPA